MIAAFAREHELRKQGNTIPGWLRGVREQLRESTACDLSNESIEPRRVSTRYIWLASLGDILDRRLGNTTTYG